MVFILRKICMYIYHFQWRDGLEIQQASSSAAPKIQHHVLSHSNRTTSATPRRRHFWVLFDRSWMSWLCRSTPRWWRVSPQRSVVDGPRGELIQDQRVHGQPRWLNQLLGLKKNPGPNHTLLAHLADWIFAVKKKTTTVVDTWCVLRRLLPTTLL
jgi:hypothetical protein